MRKRGRTESDRGLQSFRLIVDNQLRRRPLYTRNRAVVTSAHPGQLIEWARTGSNRRPLVCKSEPDGPPRFTWCHSVFKCAGQRLVRFHCVHGVSGCFCPSWHTLGTTGVWSSDFWSLRHPVPAATSSKQVGGCDLSTKWVDLSSRSRYYSNVPKIISLRSNEGGVSRGR